MAWTAPNGKGRLGIVSDDLFTLSAVKRSAQVGQSKEAQCKAVVIPADGGEALPLCPKTKRNPQAVIKDGGKWRPARPYHSQSNSQKEQAA